MIRYHFVWNLLLTSMIKYSIVLGKLMLLKFISTSTKMWHQSFSQLKKIPLRFVRTFNRVTRPATTGHRVCKRTSMWVSPIVAFPKTNDPDKFKICVYMCQPNNPIQKERHPQRTIDDLINDLNGARHINKLNHASAYHQLELDEESRYITTFTTHKGLYQYERWKFDSI